MGALALLFLFAVALIAGPIVASVTNHPLGGLTSTLMTGSGIALAILSGVLIIITRLYVKTKADEAIVRTGMGGIKVIMDGGAIVIPVIHEIKHVPLGSLRLQMNRDGINALITSDKLRADIAAEFYVKVQPNTEEITIAARSLGDRLQTPSKVAELVEDKLVSALRTVAAKHTLEELNSDRNSFVGEVMQIVTDDMKHNGLTLESVTISKLDQTDPKSLRDDNIFDAQGMATIARIVQEKKTERNKLEREGEQARTTQDVTTRKAVLGLEQDRSKAEAEQSSQIAVIQAAQRQTSEQKKLAADQAIALSGVDKDKATEVALRAKQQAIEVAEREKLAAIATADAKKAEAEQACSEAEAKAEEARQSVTTVTVTAEAEREKRKRVIDAGATAESTYVTTQKDADGKAYATQKDAEGRKAAAAADAEAITVKATAESNAAKARAEGATAEGMVPVEVERKRVEVLTQELTARAEHGDAMQKFELAKIRIVKEAEVRIAAAQATATLVGKIEGRIVGTPEDVARMTKAWMSGMGVATTVDGFMDTIGEKSLGVAGAAGSALEALTEAVATRLANKTPTGTDGPQNGAASTGG